jgi:hypothetical protein
MLQLRKGVLDSFSLLISYVADAECRCIEHCVNNVNDNWKYYLVILSGRNILDWVNDVAVKKWNG